MNATDHPWMISSTEGTRIDSRVSWIIRRLKDGLGNLATSNQCVASALHDSFLQVRIQLKFFLSGGRCSVQSSDLVEVR